MRFSGLAACRGAPRAGSRSEARDVRCSSCGTSHGNRATALKDPRERSSPPSEVRGRTAMLEKILVATDFSEPSRVVYPMASHAARELGSEIHLVHVVSPLPPLYYEEVWVNVAEEGYYETLADRL